MVYYQYFLGTVQLIGSNKQEIINTLTYYKEERGFPGLVVPAEEDISPLEGKLTIHCYSPLGDENLIDAPVRGDVILKITHNAYDDVVAQVEGLLEEKRGGLYKFEPSLQLPVLLPLDVVEAMQAYDWRQHSTELAVASRKARRALAALERGGGIQRIRGKGAGGHKN